MFDFPLLSFAFSAGLISFFSPCAVAMLPAYIGYFVGKEEQKIDHNWTAHLIKGAFLGLSASLGFIVLFGSAGLLLSTVRTLINEQVIGSIGLLLGVALTVWGVSLFFTQKFSLNLNFVHVSKKSGFVPFFIYGIAYALAALSCTFPIFLAISFQGFATQGFIGGMSLFTSYALGMASVMVAISIAVALGKGFIAKYLNNLLRYISPLTATIVLLSGLYIIWFHLHNSFRII